MRKPSTSNDESPASMTRHRQGQAGPGQPGLHGIGALPDANDTAGAADGPAVPDKPVPPAGGRAVDQKDGGHTIRDPGTVADIDTVADLRDAERLLRS